MQIRCAQRGTVSVVDDIDHRIVALLRENARRSFQDIGARVALSAQAV
jgi:DNA-binding Lrp family transcriptional regulator